MDLLVRYSNHEDALGRVVKVLGQIERGDPDNEPGVAILAGSRPRGLAKLDDGDVRQLVSSFRAGMTKCALAEQYGISESTVKRLLRKQGVRKKRGYPGTA